MPGRDTVLGLPNWRAETVKSAVAGPVSTSVPAGVDPAAATDVSLALRVPAFAVVTLALGLGAHLTAGGGPPTPGSALLIGVLLGIAGRLFALREQSLPRLAAMVWSVQAGIHFVLLAGHQQSGAHLTALRVGGHHLQLTPAAPPVGQAATQWAGAASTIDPSGQAATGAVVSAAGHSNSLTMLVLHAFAGLAVAAWLRRGEAAAFNAARRILPRLIPGRTRTNVRPVFHRTLPISTAPARPAGRRFLCLAAPRRGPPLRTV